MTLTRQQIELIKNHCEALIAFSSANKLSNWSQFSSFLDNQAFETKDLSPIFFDLEANEGNYLKQLSHSTRNNLEAFFKATNLSLTKLIIIRKINASFSFAANLKNEKRIRLMNINNLNFVVRLAHYYPWIFRVVKIETESGLNTIASYTRPLDFFSSLFQLLYNEKKAFFKNKIAGLTEHSLLVAQEQLDEKEFVKIETNSYYSKVKSILLNYWFKNSFSFKLHSSPDDWVTTFSQFESIRRQRGISFQELDKAIANEKTISAGGNVTGAALLDIASTAAALNDGLLSAVIKQYQNDYGLAWKSALFSTDRHGYNILHFLAHSIAAKVELGNSVLEQDWKVYQDLLSLAPELAQQENSFTESPEEILSSAGLTEVGTLVFSVATN